MYIAGSLKDRGNRIACIYFPISSVGGINTECATFRRAALAAGDRLDILSCPNQKTKAPQLFPEPISVRGGDTRITIDGEVSHHPSRVEATARWLEANYDGLFFIHPCPHPTKAYGTAPDWGAMYELPRLPKVTRFVDAYYESYRWIDPYLRYVKTIFVNQPAYAIPIKHLNAELLPKPFLPYQTTMPRSKKPLMVWTSQWKKIKGCWDFIRVLPKIEMRVDLYSNGIEYYQMRGTEEWDRAVGSDLFGGGPGVTLGHQGRADHVFHGYIPLGQIPEILAEAWMMVDLQGYKSRYAAYTEGSYNNTTVEALWYGATPILHKNAAKGPLPQECCVFVESAEEIPAVARKVKPLGEKGQAWVRARHNGMKIYARLREALLR